MTITVKHKFVSAIPDEADATVVRPSNWNDDHQLTGVIDVANGGTGATTLTGYVKGSGTSAMTASTTIPSGDVSGLGTMATQNANAVAITGGTVNGTTIGATTASTGAFTYASTSSTTSTTPVLSFNGSNTNLASGATVSSSYLQNILQNKSGTAGASTNYVLSNDLGTDSSYYGEFGMNSSVYSSGTPADFFSLNNGVYFSGHDGDITVGSGNGYKTYLAWGTTGDKAHVINATGALGLNTNITGTTNFGTSGQVLTSAGSAATPTWTTPTTGTVTSVGLSAPSIFTVGNSPVTSSGTLALTYSGTALPVANGGTGVTTSTGSGSTVLNTSPTLTTPAITGGTISNLTQELIGQSTDQGTGVLQVTGQSTFNGTVVDKSLNLQGGNNLLTYSQDFTNAAWGKNNGSTVTANSAVAPDGTTTADTISFTADELSRVQQFTTSSILQFTTYSIWLKVNSGTVNIRFGDASSLGVITITSTWQRFTFSSLTGSPNFTLRNAVAGTAINFYAWGAQLELGSVASAYTPTTITAITTTNNISVPSGQVLVKNGTTALPSYSFGSSTNSGINWDGTNIYFICNGNNPVYLSSNGLNLTAGKPIYLASDGYIVWNNDTALFRDAANIIAQRANTSAQTFRLYNTYTSTSLGEWLSVDWSTTANTATIATKANGAGVVRTLATGNPLVISTGYTVATLPTGVVGMRAYVTDALLPTYLGTLTGGGAVKCPVFYNGTAWVSA